MGDHRSYDADTPAADEREALQWDELRELLTGPEQRQLARILRRLDDPVRRARDLNQVLPDALSLGGPVNARVVRALQPLIDTAMKRSARRNPKILADAIFPSLGPAIRKAISATLMGMVQSLNHVLNQSFSLQGLKWRIEAIRTQKNFAEVVLLHTLVYRVEQVYLIHRQSGIMLQHAETSQIDRKDPDMVSGMLTAIQDFVRDSFDSDSGEFIDTLRMDGDHSVWIEQGADALLAVVIRGTPPVELRHRFRELLDAAHTRFGPTLENFDGDTAPFNMFRPDLDEALVFQVREHHQRISPFLWLLTAVVLLGVALWGWRAYVTHSHWMDLLTQLRGQQGIVVTRAEKSGGVYHIEGLRDSQAMGIDDMVTSSGIDSDDLNITWTPFMALDSAAVLKRAHDVLQPPDSVELTLTDGVLEADGSAPHRWIQRFKSDYRTVAGVRDYDDDGLRDVEMARMITIVDDLRQQVLYFDRGDYLLPDAQKTVLDESTKIITEIQALGRTMGIDVAIHIIGQADVTGTRAYNLELSRRRARTVRDALILHGIDPGRLESIGAGTRISEGASKTTKTQNADRSVRFEALLDAE